jgi:rubrerythrin
MIVHELLILARQVENRMARLYEHMARDFEEDPVFAKLLHNLAQQELGHADLVTRMIDALEDDNGEVIFETSYLTNIMDSIDDIEDEVCVRGITSESALEIILHLEATVAERFYLQIPDSVPGIDYKLIKQLANSCNVHAQEIARVQTYLMDK